MEVLNLKEWVSSKNQKVQFVVRRRTSILCEVRRLIDNNIYKLDQLINLMYYNDKYRGGEFYLDFFHPDLKTIYIKAHYNENDRLKIGFFETVINNII